MIFVILALGILMVVCGTILYSKLEPDKDGIGIAFQIIGVIVIISSIIAFVSLLKCVLDRVGIDKKIAMYETENTKIEQQIVDVKEIKELKNMTVNASFYRWWLYFGK